LELAEQPAKRAFETRIELRHDPSLGRTCLNRMLSPGCSVILFGGRNDSHDRNASEFCSLPQGWSRAMLLRFRRHDRCSCHLLRRRHPLGDEGKGKIIDLLAEDADVVARFGGGHNAGHTLIASASAGPAPDPVGDSEERGRQRDRNGVVVDPWHLIGEIDRLRLVVCA